MRQVVVGIEDVGDVGHVWTSDGKMLLQMQLCEMLDVEGVDGHGPGDGMG